MKQLWIKYSTRIDAMSLRERAMLFAAAVGVMIFLLYTVVLEPLYARQKTLLAQIKQQQNQMIGIDGEITSRIAGAAVDPDLAVRTQLGALQRQVQEQGAALRAVQRGLVPPERMVPLLEQLLRANAKLRLLSLRTLPVSGLSEGMAPPTRAEAQIAADGKAAPAATVKPRELLYRHGVEMELQGSYLDMVNYMAALEALPVQLFWGKASLNAQEYPNLKLTLTLHTLSLDQKWMKL